MTREDIYKVLTGIFRDVFKRNVDLKPDLTAKDVAGWDSFRHIDILMAAEQAFSIKLTTEEIDNMRQLGDLVDIIAAKTNG